MICEILRKMMHLSDNLIYFAQVASRPITLAGTRQGAMTELQASGGFPMHFEARPHAAQILPHCLMPRLTVGIGRQTRMHACGERWKNRQPCAASPPGASAPRTDATPPAA